MMRTKYINSEEQSLLKKDRYLAHLSKEENETLDIIADIIAKYIIKKGEELNTERKRQSDSNRHSTDSE